MKKEGYVGFICLVTLCFVLIFAVPSYSQEKVVQLKYASFWPPMSTMSGVAEQWCKEVEKRTNGAVKITFLPGGTLVPATQSYEAAVKGITDISMTATQWTAGRFPLTEAIFLPLGIRSSQQGTKLLNAWYKKFKPKEYDDVKVLYFFTSGPSHFMTVKPIASIKDLKGLKIRGGGETMKQISAMGAIPISVPISDAYEAFQRGICDGVLISSNTLKAYRWGDLLRGIQINDGLGSVAVLLVTINKKKWNSLPPDVQKVMEQVSDEWMTKTAKIWDEVDDLEAIEFAQTKGLKVFKISKEEQAVTAQNVRPLLDGYVSSMKKLGLPGEQSLQFAVDYLKANP